MTKDEALRVAREALEHVLLWAGDDEPKPACVIDAEAALRTIALAGEAPSDPQPKPPTNEDIDRLYDVVLRQFAERLNLLPDEVNVDPKTHPSFYRALMHSAWLDGWIASSPAVQSVALAGGWGELREGRDFDRTSASGAVVAGKAAQPVERVKVGELLLPGISGPEYDEPEVLTRMNELELLQARLVHDGTDRVLDLFVELPAGLPGTSNGQESGNGK